MVWNVITDYKTIGFKWFENLYNCICEFAKCHKLSLNLLETPEECSSLSDDSILILLGNNHEWLDKIEKNICFKNITVVLMLGDRNFSNNNTINIRYDLSSAMKQSIALLSEKNRTRPACFGITCNDSSDLIKADAFAMQFGYNNIYYYKNGIENCFDDFLSNIECYDSVICSNDIMALFLQKKCIDHGILIPERLHIISMGNLWISAHTNPSISTFDNENNKLVSVLWRLLNGGKNTILYSKVDIYLNPEIIRRESTGDIPIITQMQKSDRYSPVVNFGDDLEYQISQIHNLNLSFSSFSELEINILRELIKNKTYGEIAAEFFISTDTVKYHIKKIYSRLKIHTRKELLNVIAEYHIRLEKKMR